MELSITPLATLPGTTTAALGDASAEGLNGGFAALLAGQINGLELLFPATTPLIDPALAALLSGEGKKINGTDELLHGDEENVSNLFAALPQPAADTLSLRTEAANDALIGSAAGKGKDGNSSELLALLSQSRAPRGETNTGQATTPPDEVPLPTGATGAHAARPGEHTPTATQNNTPSITAPLHDNKWSQQLSDRVLWLARGDVQSAQINITPAHLGPIQVNLSLNGEQMSAHFVSAHQEVRQALEDALPRLREMLAGAGINLGQANVGSQQQQQAQPEQFAAAGENFRQDGDGAILPAHQPDADMTHALPVKQGAGLVDLFA